MVKRRRLAEKLNRLDKLVHEQPKLKGTSKRCPPTLKDVPENILRIERMKKKKYRPRASGDAIEEGRGAAPSTGKDLAKEKEIAENCINTLKTYSEKVKAAHDIATQQGTSMHSNLSKIKIVQLKIQK